MLTLEVDACFGDVTSESGEMRPGGFFVALCWRIWLCYGPVGGTCPWGGVFDVIITWHVSEWLISLFIISHPLLSTVEIMR